MTETTSTIYQQIADRTGGDIYIGVVGPVRTGKSTFVKRMMEQLVIPNIDNIYQKERARDELPQSGSGRTIMTSEPKFVPEEAVSISPDGQAVLSVRLIDSVGYMIPGVMGAEEEGRPRMVTTPWLSHEIPMTEAAELGTKKIMEDHCSVGIVVTTDGTVQDIPREDFVNAERRAIEDMKATGKPFLVLINSAQPKGDTAKILEQQISEAFHVRCIRTNCLTLNENTIRDILCGLLYEFPISEMRIYLPRWFAALPMLNKYKKELYENLRQCASDIKTLQDMQYLSETIHTDTVTETEIDQIDLGTGVVSCRLHISDELFYQTLSEYAGIDVHDDAELMRLLAELSSIKRSYEKIETALQQVYATGYGIVMPKPDEMQLEVPKITKKGSNYGVKLKASAPSIHMVRADIQTEINPMIGDEKQSQELLRYLLDEYENDMEKLWQSNIFGKSVYALINEGLTTKLKRMPEEAQSKLQSTLSRIINEESTGLLCIILA